MQQQQVKKVTGALLRSGLNYKRMVELLHIDCMLYMKGLPDKAFDLAIVDPPYGIGNYWMKQKHTSHYGKKSWNETVPDENYFNELFRVSENQIIFGANYYCYYLPISNSWIIWDKGNSVEKMNTSECELAWTSFKVPMRKVFVQWSGGRKGIETGVPNIHPCQRPIKLHKWLLNNYATSGNKILDTHLGSGSSAIAAHSMGFDFVGCELDKDYYDAACKRFKEQTMQQKLFL